MQMTKNINNDVSKDSPNNENQGVRKTRIGYLRTADADADGKMRIEKWDGKKN